MSHLDIVNEQRIDTKGLRSLFCSTSELDRSYKRCRSLGVSTEVTKPLICLEESACAARIETKWFLVSATERVLQREAYDVPEEMCIYVLCDSQLAVLKLFSATEALSVARGLGIAPGAVLSEESFGTNSLALSKEYRRTLAIQGRHHYCQVLKKWSSVAQPVKNPQRNVLGYLGLSICHDNLPWYARAVLDFLVLSIERQIQFIYPDQDSSVTPGAVSTLPDGGDQLTKREKEVLTLKARGLSAKEIAVELSLSVHTVATHNRNICSKLGIDSIMRFAHDHPQSG